jgi:hypothetical protein
VRWSGAAAGTSDPSPAEGLSVGLYSTVTAGPSAAHSLTLAPPTATVAPRQGSILINPASAVVALARLGLIIDGGQFDDFIALSRSQE